MNGLEALKKLPKWLDDEHRDSEEEYFKASEEYKTIEKELKALEIIKKKLVSVSEVLMTANVEYYNNGYSEEFHLTQDEFDLLKEVLK